MLSSKQVFQIKMYKNNKPKSIKKVIIVILVLAAIFVVSFLVWKLLIKNPKTESQSDQVSKTTSTAPTAQENFTDGTDREPGNSLGEDQGYGYVEENLTPPANIPDKSNWITSSTREITVYSPTNNKQFKSGDSISGESTLSTVSFRLIDNISGVIARGQLQVTNGKFSGTFNFQTNATEARLDVFATDSQAAEFSNVEIPLRLQR